jgi:hypothetical protein
MARRVTDVMHRSVVAVLDDDTIEQITAVPPVDPTGGLVTTARKGARP